METVASLIARAAYSRPTPILLAISYNFDPVNNSIQARSAFGSVTFDRRIQGLIVEQDSLVNTDAVLGVIGRCTTGNRAFDLTGADSLSVSNDLRTMTLSLTAADDEIVQLRVLLTANAICDFNSDQACDVADMNLMFAEGDLLMGVGVGAGNQFDLNIDLMIDQTDIDRWLDNAANQNGYDSFLASLF